MHAASLASGIMLQEGGGTNALLPTRGFPFLLLPPPPSLSYSHFYSPHSLGPRDVAFDGERFCRVTWHRAVGCDQLWLAVTWHAVVVVGAA
jgi:hypothetical protein